MNLSFLKKIYPVILLCLATQSSLLMADADPSDNTLSPELTCEQYKIHFDNLQMDVFMFPSDDLKDDEGEPRKLVDIQEEFDRLSAQLSIYQGLQSLREKTIHLTRKTNPSSEFRETFVNLVIAENILEMAEDFSHNTTASESMHQQLTKHIKDKCRSESAKYAFCQLNDIENTETLFLIDSLIIAYEIARHNPSPSRIKNSPFVKEFHTLFDNAETERILNRAYFKLEENKIEDEQGQIREYYEKISKYYSPEKLEEDIPEIDHRNINAKIQELTSSLKNLNQAIEEIKTDLRYEEIDWLKNYVAFKMGQTCSEEDFQFIPLSNSTCFQSSLLGGIKEELVMFSGDFVGFVSRSKSESLITQDLEDLCARVHRRLQPLKSDELIGPLQHYREVYAPFCSPWFNDVANVIAENLPPHIIPPKPLTMPSRTDAETNQQADSGATEEESGGNPSIQQPNNGTTTEEGIALTASDTKATTPPVSSGTTQPLLPQGFTFDNPSASSQSGTQPPPFLTNPLFANSQQDNEAASGNEERPDNSLLPSTTFVENTTNSNIAPPEQTRQRTQSIQQLNNNTAESNTEQTTQQASEEEATTTENSDSQFESPDLETPTKNPTTERYFQTPSFGKFPRTTIYRDSKGSVTGSYTRAKGHVPWLMATAQTTASISNWFTTDYIPRQNYLSNPLINNELFYYTPPANNPWANFTNQKTWNSYIEYMDERAGSPNPFANPAYFNRTRLEHVPYGPSFNPAYRPNYGLPQ